MEKMMRGYVESCMSFRAMKGTLLKFDSGQKNRFTKCYMIVNTIGFF